MLLMRRTGEKQLVLLAYCTLTLVPSSAWGVGWGQKIPTLTLNINNFFILKQMPPTLVTFPKIYLAAIWFDISWSMELDVSTATIFCQACFSKLQISCTFNQNFPIVFF